MNRHRRNGMVVLFLLAAFACARAAAGEGEITFIKGYVDTRVDEKGDATITTRMVFPTTQMFQELKNRFPNPFAIMRHVFGNNNRAVIENPAVVYDDSSRAVVVTADRAGVAWTRRNRWEMDIEGANSDMVHSEDGLAIFVENAVEPPATITTAVLRVFLPPGGANIAYDKSRRVLSYSLDRAPIEQGRGRLDCELTARANIMSALYKLYGDNKFNNGNMWVGKAVFRNLGDADITDLRVSYRVGEFADWSSDSRYDLIPPGGTVVDCYYPLFKSSAMELVNITPVDIQVRYSYRDASGQRHEDNDSDRSRILGRNSFEFSSLPDAEAVTWADRFINAPLVASFVTRMDPVVREFAGFASQASGGSAAMVDDEQAIRFMMAAYNQMVANGISYQSPTGYMTEKASLVQELKYPRDVLRDKSATCIELAAFYAAVCESNGLETGLVLLPGHCFSVVKLPSGQMLPVENTGVLGAAVGKAASFEEAVKAGRKNMESLKPGMFYLVNVKKAQSLGIVPPELPTLPPDILRSWGIAYRDGSGRQAPPGKEQKESAPPRPESGPETTRARTRGGDELAGRWTASVTNNQSGKTFNVDFDIAFRSGRYAGSILSEGESEPNEIVRAALENGRAEVVTLMAIGEEDPNARVLAHFIGDVTDGVWTGTYAMVYEPTGETMADGAFTAKRGGQPASTPPRRQPAPPTGDASSSGLAGNWEGVYSVEKQDFRMTLDVKGSGRAYSGVMRMLDENIAASVEQAQTSDNKARLKASWLIGRQDGKEVFRHVFFTGELNDGVWSGNFNVKQDGVEETLVRGKFQLRKGGTPSTPPSQTARPAPSSGPARTQPAAGDFVGVWSGTYKELDGNTETIRVELGIENGDYKGRIHLGEASAEIYSANLVDNLLSVVAVWMAAGPDGSPAPYSFGLLGQLQGSTWTGQYTLMRNTETLGVSTFQLRR